MEARSPIRQTSLFGSAGTLSVMQQSRVVGAQPAQLILTPLNQHFETLLQFLFLLYSAAHLCRVTKFEQCGIVNW